MATTTSVLLRRLGYAKINDPWHWNAIVQCDQDVGGFDVPVDNSLLVSVLNGMTNLDKQIEAIPD